MARVRQRLAIIDEELSSITEAEFRSSLAGESLPPSPRPEPLEHLKEMLKGILGGPKKDKVGAPGRAAPVGQRKRVRWCEER